MEQNIDIIILVSVFLMQNSNEFNLILWSEKLRLSINNINSVFFNKLSK